MIFKNFWNSVALSEKCPYSEFFLSAFSRIRTDILSRILRHRVYGKYLVQMRENTDQENFEYGHFSRSVGGVFKTLSNMHDGAFLQKY